MGAVHPQESPPFHGIFCEIKNLPIPRQLIPKFLSAPAWSAGAITVIMLRTPHKQASWLSRLVGMQTSLGWLLVPLGV